MRTYCIAQETTECSGMTWMGRQSNEEGHTCMYGWASLVAQVIKNPAAMRKTWVRSLGLEDPLEEGMATHPSTLPWRIPWTEDSSRQQSMGSQRVRCN